MLTRLEALSAAESWIEWHDFDFVVIPSQPVQAVSSVDWFADMFERWTSRDGDFNDDTLLAELATWIRASVGAGNDVGGVGVSVV